MSANRPAHHLLRLSSESGGRGLGVGEYRVLGGWIAGSTAADMRCHASVVLVALWYSPLFLVPRWVSWRCGQAGRTEAFKIGSKTDWRCIQSVVCDCEKQFAFICLVFPAKWGLYMPTAQHYSMGLYDNLIMPRPGWAMGFAQIGSFFAGEGERGRGWRTDWQQTYSCTVHCHSVLHIHDIVFGYTV